MFLGFCICAVESFVLLGCGTMWYGAQHFSTDAVPNLRGTKTSEYRKDNIFAIKCYFSIYETQQNVHTGCASSVTSYNS